MVCNVRKYSEVMLLDAKEEFEEAIKEIDLLIDYAKRNQKNINKYATFNKSAVVLLCAKFEAFLEGFLEEYACMHLEKSTNKNLNLDFQEHLIDCIMESLSVTKSNKIKRKAHIKSLITLCGDDEVVDIEEFKYNNKFNYGKHGQTEVERLLKGFGFSNFLSEDHVKLFFEKFNSLNGMRNNIIHQDKTPSLTHQTVGEYKEVTHSFVRNLQVYALTLV
jgi:hypothetical protein